MKKAMSYAKEFFHRADIFLLVMGLICAIFGIVVISSATASYHSAKYVIVQSASLILGVFAFVVMTVLDVDVLADKWQILCAFNVVFLLLLIPFGVSDNTGNTGWLRFFGIGIQPTEVVKLTFIIILAKQISYLKEYHDLNSVWSVAQLAVHFVLLFGLIRNLRALKDEKKLKQQYVKEGDERQKQIYTNALCAAMRATLILGLAAVIVAGDFSMTVSLTLLVTVLLVSLMTLAFKLYFGKKY